MIVAVARLQLHIHHSHSLKEKRAVIRKIVDRTRARFHLHVAEVGGQDTWQRAVLGFAVVGSDAGKAQALVDEVVRSIDGLGEGELVAVDRELIRLGDGEGQTGGGWQ